VPGWIGLVVLAVNFIVALRKPKAGAWLYLVLIFTLPHSQIAGRSVGYDIIGFIPLAASIAFVNKGKLKNPNLLYAITPLYPALMIFSTWISSTFYGFKIEPLLTFGIVRFCFLLYVFIETLDEKHIYNATISIVLINFVTCIVQLYYPQESIGVFYSLYGQETHSVLRGYYESGSFARPTGTLLSPVNVGVLIMLAYSVCIHRILASSRSSKHYLSVLLVIATGILSLTKTALLGIPLLTLLVFFLKSAAINPRSISDVYISLSSYFKRSLFAFSFLSLVYLIYYVLSESSYGYQIVYYAGFLLDPLEAFESRYMEGGQLEETIEVTSRYPLLGLGATRAQGEFLGDSTLIRVAHDTGVVGVLLHFSIYIYVLYNIISRREYLKTLVMLSLFISGFALFTFYTKYGAVAVSYCMLSESGDVLDT